MRTLLCICLFLLPTLTMAQSFYETSKHRDLFPSITAVPLTPHVTEYQGSDGSRTTLIQTTPNTQYYSSQDRHGRDAGSGVIVSPYTVKPFEPTRVPPPITTQR